MAAEEPDDLISRVTGKLGGGAGERLGWPEASPVGPLSPLLPGEFLFDRDAQDRMMQAASETFQEVHDEKLARDQRVIDALEAVKAELVASGEREADALRRADDAERLNRSMRWIAAASLIVSILAIIVAVLAR